MLPQKKKTVWMAEKLEVHFFGGTVCFLCMLTFINGVLLKKPKTKKGKYVVLLSWNKTQMIVVNIKKEPTVYD